jgi:hypothetical protein
MVSSGARDRKEVEITSIPGCIGPMQGPPGGGTSESQLDELRARLSTGYVRGQLPRT